jgi:hypothetical protein
VVFDLFQDLSRVKVEDLRAEREPHVQKGAEKGEEAGEEDEEDEERTRLTWTRPESSPATSKLPSLRISPLLAVSLNRAIVLTTLFVLGA